MRDLLSFAIMAAPAYVPLFGIFALDWLAGPTRAEVEDIH